MAVVALVALANLRGLRESGRVFAVPTYAFVVLCGGLVVVGIVRWLTGRPACRSGRPDRQHEAADQGFALVFLVLRAFSGGLLAP